MFLTVATVKFFREPKSIELRTTTVLQINAMYQLLKPIWKIENK